MCGEIRLPAPGAFSFEVGMRIRLTRNMDKQRGFVNGAMGVVEHVLASDVFVLKTTHGVRILVHKVKLDGVFMPTTYAYAMTIRRAQGTTLDLAGLLFDRACADRGYGYVGASGVRKANYRRRLRRRSRDFPEVARC